MAITKGKAPVKGTKKKTSGGKPSDYNARGYHSKLYAGGKGK